MNPSDGGKNLNLNKGAFFDNMKRRGSNGSVFEILLGGDHNTMQKSKLMAIAMFGIAVILSGCGSDSFGSSSHSWAEFSGETSEVSSDGVGVSIHLDEAQLAFIYNPSGMWRYGWRSDNIKIIQRWAYEYSENYVLF